MFLYLSAKDNEYLARHPAPAPPPAWFAPVGLLMLTLCELVCRVGSTCLCVAVWCAGCRVGERLATGLSPARPLRAPCELVHPVRRHPASLRSLVLVTPHAFDNIPHLQANLSHLSRFHWTQHWRSVCHILPATSIRSRRCFRRHLFPPFFGVSFNPFLFLFIHIYGRQKFLLGRRSKTTLLQWVLMADPMGP